jgi:hypothetical protein
LVVVEAAVLIGHIPQEVLEVMAVVVAVHLDMDQTAVKVLD